MKDKETGIPCFKCKRRSGIDCAGREPDEATLCEQCFKERLKMSNNGFKAGMRVCLSDGVYDAGRCGSVVGNEVLVGQWWCPILWDGADDPSFHKSSCLEPLGEMELED